jgi:hypothetical protein
VHLGKDVITITKAEDSVCVANFKQAIWATLSERVSDKSITRPDTPEKALKYQSKLTKTLA